MKKIVILLFLVAQCAGASEENEYILARTKARAFLRTVGHYQCFSNIFMHKAEHAWEKTYVEIESPFVVIDQDDSGFLLAQPNPDLCMAKGRACRDYWIRSEHQAEVFLHNNYAKVDCPKQINKTFIKNLIKAQYKDAIDIKALP
jgi:hypothetical protein